MNEEWLPALGARNLTVFVISLSDYFLFAAAFIDKLVRTAAKCNDH